MPWGHAWGPSVGDRAGWDLLRKGVVVEREIKQGSKVITTPGGAEPLMDSYSQLARNRDMYFFVLKVLFIIVCEQ